MDERVGRRGRPASVAMMLGMPLTGRGPSYTASTLARTMANDDLSIEIYTGINHLDADLNGVHVHGWRLPGPTKLRHGVQRAFGSAIDRWAEQNVLRALTGSRRPDIVYTFGETSLRFSNACREAGVIVVREKINCGKKVALDILAPLQQYGVRLPPTLNEHSVAKEKEELSIADRVFVASPMVAQSLRAVGVPDENILHSSYGWDPERFEGHHALLSRSTGVNLVFVGYICHGKGAHILLEAWERAGIEGQLILAGKMEPEIARRFGSILARPDVTSLPYTNDIGGVYRSGDWFVFPSLAEGGPQVTYEAAGNGLPALVSPMGAGAFTRDGLDGLIVAANDVDSWVEIIKSLPAREEQRREMAASALKRADDFTWENVGARRRALLLSLLHQPITQHFEGETRAITNIDPAPGDPHRSLRPNEPSHGL